MQSSIHLPVTQNVWSKTSSKQLVSYTGSSPETLLSWELKDIISIKICFG